MNRRLLHLFLVAGVMLLLFGCSNKSSNDACIHQTSQDLDAGNYDAVLASSCADAMQLGAAYFGKAGYDTKDVINRFVQTGASSTQTPLSTYMTDLIGTVDETSLSNLDSSTTQFKSIPATSDSYKDAQFNLSLVSAIQGLSLIKLVSADITGGVNTSCDINNNTIADSAEAEACALVASTNINTGSTTSCKDNTSYTPAAPVDIIITGKQGTYSGLNITVTGTATATCAAQFQKLLYKDASNKYWAVTTSADQKCTGSDGISWPCPIEQNGKPLDLVNALDLSLTTSADSMNASLTSGSSNVQQSITNIKSDACPTTCTSASVADYLQTIKK
jgi:hypothetical protein